jgi:Spy/CpxP family protein refolding chaperone
MKPHALKLSLVLALSLATLAACDKHHKKSEDAGDTTNAAAAAPATTATTAAVPSTTTAAPATAESGGGKHAWKEACADDIKKFCADADKPGKCLKEHKTELSQACVSAREAARAAHKAEKGDKAE